MMSDVERDVVGTQGEDDDMCLDAASMMINVSRLFQVVNRRIQAGGSDDSEQQDVLPSKAGVPSDQKVCNGLHTFGHPHLTATKMRAMVKLMLQGLLNPGMRWSVPRGAAGGVPTREVLQGYMQTIMFAPLGCGPGVSMFYRVFVEVAFRTFFHEGRVPVLDEAQVQGLRNVYKMLYTAHAGTGGAASPPEQVGGIFPRVAGPLRFFVRGDAAVSLNPPPPSDLETSTRSRETASQAVTRETAESEAAAVGLRAREASLEGGLRRSGSRPIVTAATTRSMSRLIGLQGSTAEAVELSVIGGSTEPVAPSPGSSGGRRHTVQAATSAAAYLEHTRALRASDNVAPEASTTPQTLDRQLQASRLQAGLDVITHPGGRAPPRPQATVPSGPSQGRQPRQRPSTVPGNPPQPNPTVRQGRVLGGSIHAELQPAGTVLTQGPQWGLPAGASLQGQPGQHESRVAVAATRQTVSEQHGGVTAGPSIGSRYPDLGVPPEGRQGSALVGAGTLGQPLLGQPPELVAADQSNIPRLQGRIPDRSSIFGRIPNVGGATPHQRPSASAGGSPLDQPRAQPIIPGQHERVMAEPYRLLHDPSGMGHHQQHPRDLSGGGFTQHPGVQPPSLPVAPVQIASVPQPELSASRAPDPSHESRRDAQHVPGSEFSAADQHPSHLQQSRHDRQDDMPMPPSTYWQQRQHQQRRQHFVPQQQHERGRQEYPQLWNDIPYAPSTASYQPGWPLQQELFVRGPDAGLYRQQTVQSMAAASPAALPGATQHPPFQFAEPQHQLLVQHPQSLSVLIRTDEQLDQLANCRRLCLVPDPTVGDVKASVLACEKLLAMIPGTAWRPMLQGLRMLRGSYETMTKKRSNVGKMGLVADTDGYAATCRIMGLQT